jgi:hypothetical protein
MGAILGAFMLIGQVYGVELNCPEVSTIKAVSRQFADRSGVWKGEQNIEDSSITAAFKFQGAAIKQGTDIETSHAYYYVACNYVGAGSDEHLRMSQRFVRLPWHRALIGMRTTNVSRAVFLNAPLT